MSKEANVKQIGLFVVGAIVILTTAVVILASGKFFKQHLYYVLYFDEALDGLSIGAPVTFRGIEVGDVKDIAIYYDHKDKSLHNVVIIRIDPERIKRFDNGRKLIANPDDMDLYIKEGFRARLKILSLITNQLSVSLDFFPNEPVVLHNYLPQYKEIPTKPTQLAEFNKMLAELPLKDIAKKLFSTIGKIEKFMDSPETKESLKTLMDTGKAANSLVKKFDRDIDPLVADLKLTTASVRKTLDQAQKTLALNEGVPGELAAKIQTTIEQAQTTLKKVDENLDNLNNFAQDNKDITYQLQSTLDEFNKVARSARELTDYLEQHPEALIRGKKEPEGERK
jgi:paraquat-inducible protein B